MIDYSKWEEVEVSLSSILLDKLNPRVIINGNVTQEKIINYLVDYFEVVDLANDINASHGLVPAERIVCIRENEQYIVVEGNRRIAACKILSNAKFLSGKHKRELKTPHEDTLKNINKIKVSLSPSRDEAEPYITLRHSDYGIKKWSTLAQVQRVMQRYNLGFKPKEISETLGMKKGDIEKSIKFYNFLEYVKNNLDWTPEELEIISNPLLETTKLDRFLPFSSKARSMLGIEFGKNYNLIIGIKENNAKKALKTIISNIYIDNIYNTRTKTEDVFNDEIAKLCEEKEDNFNNENDYTPEKSISIQDNIGTLDEKTNNNNSIIIEYTNSNDNNKTNNSNEVDIIKSANDDSKMKNKSKFITTLITMV